MSELIGTKAILHFSASVNGLGVLVARGESAGTPIHITVAGQVHRVHMWAVNNSGSNVLLTIEHGGTTIGNRIEQTITARDGTTKVIDGLVIFSEDTAYTLAAFAATENVITTFGYVEQLR